MKSPFAFLLLVLAGCGAQYEVARDIEPIELISFAPLPEFRDVPPNRVMKLKFLLCVKENGTVDQVRMLSSSGDLSWDSLAEQSIMKWRYATPLRNGVPTDVWVHQQIVVQFEEPILMALAHLSASNQAQADSLYALLETGTDFETLVRQFAGGSMQRGGSLGTVDIRTFLPRVRDRLKHLPEGQYTRPLHAGDSYVIYKRLARVVS